MKAKINSYVKIDDPVIEIDGGTEVKIIAQFKSEEFLSHKAYVVILPDSINAVILDSSFIDLENDIPIITI